jgi:hypothetical protein
MNTIKEYIDANRKTLGDHFSRIESLLLESAHRHAATRSIRVAS